MQGNIRKKNMEALKEYLTKNQAWGADIDKIVDYREAQAYYRSAIESLKEFYTTAVSDVPAKRAALFTGTFIAMKAVSDLQNVIAIYIEELRNDPANRGHIYSIPCATEKVTEEILEEYSVFFKSLLELAPDRDRWLRRFTEGQVYSSGADEAKEYEDFKNIPFTESGLKVYHLKALIRYCEILIMGIGILARDDLNFKKSCAYFEKGSTALTHLSMKYEEFLEHDPDTLSEDQLIEICKICADMYRSLMPALVSAAIPGSAVDEMTPADMISEISKCRKFKSSDKICASENNILRVLDIADHGITADSPKPVRIITHIYVAMGIGNALKLDFSEAVASAIK